MDVGVKRKDELKDWLPKDPVSRLRSRLTLSGLTDEQFIQIEEEIREEVEAAVSFARASADPNPSELRRHVFAAEDDR
jgi:pyruvate dehydrogenase E1 component alpha subunit